MDVSRFEYATKTITPASMTKRKRFARKRAAELGDIERQGWEIVSTEPERIFRRGDKITVRRARTTEAPTLSTEPLQGPGIMGWWEGLSQRQQIGVGMAAIAILISLIAAF
jgi:hypothetical protein